MMSGHSYLDAIMLLVKHIAPPKGVQNGIVYIIHNVVSSDWR